MVFIAELRNGGVKPTALVCGESRRSSTGQESCRHLILRLHDSSMEAANTLILGLDEIADQPGEPTGPLQRMCERHHRRRMTRRKSGQNSSNRLLTYRLLMPTPERESASATALSLSTRQMFVMKLLPTIPIPRA